MRKFWVLGLFLLTACATGDAPPSELAITPQVIQIQITSELTPLRTAIAACGARDPSNFLIYEEVPSPARPAERDALTFWVGNPLFDDVAIYQVGVERFSMIVHPNSTIQNLTDADVGAILTGAQPANLWLPLVGSAADQVVRSLVGAEITRNAQLAPSPAAMLDAVADDADAVGIVPQSWLTNEVRAVWESAALPILAAGESAGASDLIGCLQGR